MSDKLSDAEIVVVGGGAVGLGVAYSLAKAGRRDILLLEREHGLGKVTTSQGAGLAGQVRSSVDRTRLAMKSVATFRELEKDPDARPEWHPVGSLRIAETPERAEEFTRLEKIAAEAGLEVARISPSEASRHWPGMNFSRARAILWCPTDGYMAPASVANAYENQCRKLGVRIARSTSLEAIQVKAGRVEGVTTNRGALKTRYLVNAAGAHARHVALLAGLDFPIVPVRHEYFVTVQIPDLHPGLPCFRIPDATLYGRPSGDGVLLGGWEPGALMTDPRAYELAGRPPAIDPDHAVLQGFTRSFRELLPGVEGAEYRRVGKGWPTFTPDGKFILGESSRVRGLVMAGGCNAHGISGSAGIGSLLVEALFEARPSSYVKSLSPDRFTETSWSWEDSAVRARKVYETYYALESC